jgi:hypothetical protein
MNHAASRSLASCGVQQRGRLVREFRAGGRHWFLARSTETRGRGRPRSYSLSRNDAVAIDAGRDGSPRYCALSALSFGAGRSPNGGQQSSAPKCIPSPWGEGRVRGDRDVRKPARPHGNEINCIVTAKDSGETASPISKRSRLPGCRLQVMHWHDMGRDLRG